MRKHLLIDAPLVAGAGAWAIMGGSLLPLAAAAAAGLAVHAWATAHPRSSLYLPLTWRLPVGSAGCALTFDDGPHPAHTPAVLDRLAAHGQRATFFVIGEHAAHQGPLLRRMRAEGHAIGLHSHGHSRWFNCWSRARVRADLERCGAVIADATGERPPRLFRPPVGLKNPLVGMAVADLGLLTVTWSGRAWDTGGAAAPAIARAIAAAARPRAIVLLHDGHEPRRAGDRAATIEALDSALPALRARGLRSGALVAVGGVVGSAEGALAGDAA